MHSVARWPAGLPDAACDPPTKLAPRVNLYIKSELRECQDKFEATKNALERKQVEIELVKQEADKLHAALLATEDHAGITQLSYEQLEKQKKLILLVAQEERLAKKLEHARRAQIAAVLRAQDAQGGHSHALMSFEVPDRILTRGSGRGRATAGTDGIFRVYENQSRPTRCNGNELEDEVQADVAARLAREATTTRNAELMNARRFKSLNKALRRHERKSNSSTNCGTAGLAFEDSLKRIKKLMLATSNQIKEQHLAERASREERQNRQHSNLTALKNEIDEQRNILWNTAQIRNKKRERQERREKAAEARRLARAADAGENSDSALDSENPYMREKLLALRKQEQAHQEAIVEEQQRAREKIAAEIELEERVASKNAIERRKWDKFWEQKAKEKKQRTKLTRNQFLDDTKYWRRPKICSEERELDEFGPTDTDRFNFDLLMAELKSEGPRPQGSTEIETGSGDAAAKIGQVARKPSKLDSSGSSSFLCNPPKLIFKDFEVGEFYKQKVTVTNIGLKMQKFKFLELLNKSTDAEGSENIPKITELFDIDFQIPAPLSPGLSHDFYVTFKPVEAIRSVDLHGLLNFYSPAGGFQIAIECLQKTFVPVLSQDEIRFENVVVDNMTFLTVTITNIGAKSGVISQIVELKEDGGSPPPTTVDEYLAADTGTNGEATADVLADGEAMPRESLEEKGVDEEVRPARHRRKSTRKRSGKDKGIASIESVKQLRKSGKRLSSTQPTDELQQPVPSALIRTSAPGAAMKSTTAAKMRFDWKTEANQWLEKDLFSVVTQNTFVCYVKENRRQLLPGDTGEALTLQIHFHPRIAAQFQTVFLIKADDEVHVPPLQLKVIGHSMEFPIRIHAEPQNTDFGVCVYGFRYQQPITFTNTAKFSGRLIAHVPRVLSPFVQVVPNKVELYSLQSTSMSVIFQPRKEMMDTPELQPFFDSETKTVDFAISFWLDFPMIIVHTPICCSFQALLADSSIKVSPTELELGRCTQSETVRSFITVTNESILPQHVGFVDVPQNITIQPNYGFMPLLPNETLEFQVLVSINAKKLNSRPQQFKVQSLLLEEHIVKIHATVRPPIVRISHSKIFFPSTACGGLSFALIDIQSATRPAIPRIRQSPNSANRAEATFEFLTPPDCPVRVRPRRGVVEPGKSSKILVTFEPKITVAELAKHNAEVHKQKFDEESNRLRAELEEIDRLISQRESKAGKDEDDSQELVTGRKRDSTGSNRKANKSKKFSLDETEGKKKKLKSSTKRDSLESNRSQRESKLNSITMDDGGGAAVAGMSRAKLLRRKAKVMQALESLSPDPPSSTSLGSLSPAELDMQKRDLMQNLQPSSTNYQIACIVRNTKGAEETHVISVNCPVHKPDLIVLGLEESNVIDFGVVDMYSKKIKTVGLFNASPATLTLKMDIIHPYGPFLRLNALREILRGHVFNLRLRFAPVKQGPFQEHVLVEAHGGLLMLTLRGIGARPEFSIRPNPPIMGLGTMPKTLKVYSFEIENKSSVILEFQFEITSCGPYSGPDPPPPPRVSCVPGTMASIIPQLSVIRKKHTGSKRLTTPSRAFGAPSPSRAIGHSPSRAFGAPSPSRAFGAPSPSTAFGGPPPNYGDRICNGTFEVSMDNGAEREMTYSELVNHLETSKKDMYCQFTPKNVRVLPNSKASFNCVLMEKGRYICNFNIKLFNEIVQQSSLIA